MKYRAIKSVTRIALLIIIFSLIGGLSSCNSGKSKAEKTESIMGEFVAAWYNKDGEKLHPMYSDDIIGFDAMSTGWSYGHKDVEIFSKSEAYWATIDAELGTYFVSPDGSYSAMLSTVNYTGKGQYPIASVHALTDGKFVFIYDYYGGSISETEPLLSFEKRTLDPESNQAKEAVKESSAALLIWQTAFNDRDAAAFLSCYAEDAIYIDVVKPDWRILTMTELAADITARFATSTFASELEASTNSPIPGGCFVSADGRYAAAQGYYKDEGTGMVPMLIFLEFKDGKIVKEYNYMLVEKSLLEA